MFWFALPTYQLVSKPLVTLFCVLFSMGCYLPLTSCNDSNK